MLHVLRGGPLEIPGGGGGVKIPKKKFVQRKMPGKKIRAAITSEKKNSCKQSTNSLEKKFVQRLNALKKIPPPGISNGPPLNTY